MMNALRSATKRMFDKEIACNNEFLKPSDDRGSQSQRRNADGDLVPHVMPARAQALARRLNIGRGSSSSHTVGKKDRVDMVVVDADDEENVLWLAEGKNIQVLDLICCGQMVNMMGLS